MELFLLFFKIGLFSFGGGVAMIPLIRREVVEARGWITDEEMIDIIAIAESTPGPIAVNMATFVGSKRAGVRGAACATFGVVLPSFLTILILANVLGRMEGIPVVAYAFSGIRAGVLALIAGALLSLFQQSRRTVFSVLVMIGALFASACFDVSAILILACCAIAGLFYSRWKREN